MILTKFKEVRAVVFGVYGVLTDGRIMYNERAEQFLIFNVRDELAIQLAVKRGIKIWIISSGSSEAIRIRMQKHGVQEIYTDIDDKLSILNRLMEKYDIHPEKVLYVGDDLPDLECMRVVGLSACPSDAVYEAKQASKYISPIQGGNGIIRDVLEKIMKLQNLW